MNFSPEKLHPLSIVVISWLPGYFPFSPFGRWPTEISFLITEIESVLSTLPGTTIVNSVGFHKYLLAWNLRNNESNSYMPSLIMGISFCYTILSSVIAIFRSSTFIFDCITIVMILNVAPEAATRGVL